MKIGLSIILFLSAYLSIGQLTHVSLEVHNANPEGIGEDMVVYRLYAHLENPEGYVRGMIGTNECSPLSFGTTTTFYNNIMGDVIANPSIFLPVEIFPLAQYDSYLTLGLNETNSTLNGIQSALNPTDSLALANSFALEQGSSFYIEDGGIIIDPLELDPVGFPDENGRVMLAQLTTDGIVSYQVNLEVFLDGDPENTVFYYSQTGMSCLTPS